MIEKGGNLFLGKSCDSTDDKWIEKDYPQCVQSEILSASDYCDAATSNSNPGR